MSLSREDVLRELELLPVWKLNPSSPTRQEVTPPVEGVQAGQDDLPDSGNSGSQTEDAFKMPSLGSSLADGRREIMMKLDWQDLEECVANCQACKLGKTRTRTVFGVGDKDADLMLIGEAPGAEEDKQGEPFVGQAGKLLDNMLASIHLKRGEKVYIANVLKCRPPDNRDPHGEEVSLCDPFLKRQIELVGPKVIVVLGKFAAQSILGTDASIASLRGRLHEFHGVPVVVTYHPAYLLRNLQDKSLAWEDLCLARQVMSDLQSRSLPPST